MSTRTRTRTRVPRWRYYVRRMGAVGVLFVLLGVLALGAAAGYARIQFDRVHKDVFHHLRAAPSPGAGPVTSENILIVGNNTRIGQHEGYFGTVAEDGGARSDVTMVLHLDPAKASASLLSIPRDLFVPLPTGSMSGAHGKIDAALNNGPDNLVNAVSTELGIPIDHYVELDFDGFQNVINAIGGIPMDFPMPLRDSLSGLNITQTGCQLLNGAQALAVVRSRHLQYFTNGQWNSDPLSDLSRIRRDQLFLRTLVNTIKAKGLTNPIRAQSVLNSLVSDITIDSGFSESDMFDLGLKYRAIDPATIPALTLPITVVSGYGGYGDVDMPAQPQDEQIIAQFLGTAVPKAALGPSVSIQNVSGSYGQALNIEHGLAAAGFRVTSLSTIATVSAPSESVIDYPPGPVGLANAQGLLGALGGGAVMFPDPAVPAGTLVLQVGSVLSVLPPAPASPARTPAAASPGASVSAGTAPPPAPSPTPSVPTPGNQPVTASIFAPQPWDPTACPPGTT